MRVLKDNVVREMLDFNTSLIILAASSSKLVFATITQTLTNL